MISKTTVNMVVAILGVAWLGHLALIAALMLRNEAVPTELWASTTGVGGLVGGILIRAEGGSDLPPPPPAEEPVI